MYRAEADSKEAMVGCVRLYECRVYTHVCTRHMCMAGRGGPGMSYVIILDLKTVSVTKPAARQEGQQVTAIFLSPTPYPVQAHLAFNDGFCGCELRSPC